MSLASDPNGYLVLEDGHRFPGWLAGSQEVGEGEVVFTTNITGYQEVLTDPSFAGQIVVMTAPLIGNYGVADADAQSRRPWVSGFVTRELSVRSAGWRAEEGLLEYVHRHGIPCLTGVDTRAVTRHVRALGAMRAIIVPASWSPSRSLERVAASAPMEGRDLASQVTTPEPYTVAAGKDSHGVVVCLDFGVKRRSIDLIAGAGFDVRVLPAWSRMEEILEERPAGVFLSNGPGDPAAIPEAPRRIRELTSAGLPVFGICLGCQLLALAFGGKTFKLPYGHRGGNHPVRDLSTGKVEITSQNHGFAIVGDGDGIPGAPELEVTHRSLNDGTIEGVRHRRLPAFAVQYHPEAAPGPHDSRHLFDRFVEAVNATRALATG